MAYQGTYDLAEMAKDLAETIVNGNWSDAIAEIKKLNSLQCLYLIDCLLDDDGLCLTRGQIKRLALIASSSMNNGESGKGYISDNQECDDE